MILHIFYVTVNAVTINHMDPCASPYANDMRRAMFIVDNNNNNNNIDDKLICEQLN